MEAEHESAKKQRKPISPVLVNLIAGSVSGIASTIICHPFDTIRTRLQNPAYSYTSVSRCVVHTVQNEGVLALYQGMATPLAAQAVYKSIIFATNSFAQKILFEKTDQSAKKTFICAGISGAVNSLVVSPVELIRNRLMVQNRKSERVLGPIGLAKQIVQSKGIFGIWQGLVPTMLRDVPGVSCWLLGFDWAKQQLKKSNRTNSLSLGDLLIAGSFGGICFWAVALPIDTVKSAYQLSPNPVGLLDLARSLVREKGIYHLFRAWPVAFGRGIPGSATTLAVYELVSNHLVNQ